MILYHHRQQAHQMANRKARGDVLLLLASHVCYYGLLGAFMTDEQKQAASGSRSVTEDSLSARLV
jgi:hypothetical protein